MAAKPHIELGATPSSYNIRRTLSKGYSPCHCVSRSRQQLPKSCMKQQREHIAGENVPPHHIPAGAASPPRPVLTLAPDRTHHLGVTNNAQNWVSPAVLLAGELHK